jgi:2-desacetyl-2-hydroxyethyl bacteriochlorophyllide A dehydrogenase
VVTVTARGGGGSRTARAVWFEAVRKAVVREESVESPRGGQVTVQSTVSLISPGTEMQVYRGQISPETDLGLETCSGSFGFPVKYAYQVVGKVLEVGREVPLAVGDVVFARHPHQDLFTMRYNPDLVFRLPRGMDPEVAVFANLADVALNALLDVPVRIGDVVVVFGQGIVGLFCTLFASRTAGHLIVVDPIEERRQRGVQYGADRAVHPDEVAQAVFDATGGRGVDIAIEVSGAPPALQQAISVTGQEGVIVAVSYYGSRPVTLTLAPEFHFRRQRIVSSQVSSVGSGLQTRWSFGRRMDTVLSLLSDTTVKGMVSHRFQLSAAPAAYELLDTQPGSALGVILQHTQG